MSPYQRIQLQKSMLFSTQIDQIIHENRSNDQQKVVKCSTNIEKGKYFVQELYPGPPA